MCKVEIGRVGWHPKGSFPYRCDRNVNSPLKNPFGGKVASKTIGKVGREEACKLFSEYFKEQMTIPTSKVFKAVRLLLSKARSGNFESIYLQCHCYPIFKPCHCETIKQHIEQELQNELN